MPELRPYQIEDKNRILEQKRIGLFNEQRTGKTPTICVALKEANVKNPIIVCPTSMLYVWASEYKTWTGYNTIVIKDISTFSKSNIPYNTAIIINYEKLRYIKNKTYIYAKLLLSIKSTGVVFDEAHTMCNRDSDQSKAALLIARHTEFCITATGTPSRNKPWDVWSLLHITFPREFTSYWQFVDTYFHIKKDYYSKFGKPTHFRKGMDIALAMDLQKYTIQRKRKELRQWETDIQPICVKLPCTPLQRLMITGFEEYFEYDEIVTKTILDNLIRIRQTCAHPNILLAGKPAESPKYEWLKTYLQDYPEKQVLVFSLSRKFIDIIHPQLHTEKVSVDVITGDTPYKRRAELVTMFQENKIQCLLVQTQTGKEGLTLDAADTTVFLDNYPPASMYMQAKDRMVAVSEERQKPKELYHLMMEDTYDAILYDLVESNINESEVINDYKNYLERRKTDGTTATV